MRKTIALLLALVMCLTLCACTPSKEKMLEEAITISFNSVWNEYLDNAASATAKYDGKTVLWKATVYEIGESYVEMAESTYQGLPLNSVSVHFKDSNDLMNLSRLDVITVVGTLRLHSFSKIENAYIVEG